MAKPGDDRFGVIIYVHQMLEQLHQMAESERCQMLAYLIEMAYIESGDLVRGGQLSAVREYDQNGAP